MSAAAAPRQDLECQVCGYVAPIVHHPLRAYFFACS